MKSKMERFRAGLFGKITPFIIFLLIISVPVSAFAVNTDLVEDELYWINKGNIIQYNKDDYFEGFLKYITDEDEGCFYLFIRFTDHRIDVDCKENIALGFTVKNEENTYSFQVDKDGVINSPSKNSLDAFDVYYNFNEASCKKQGGGVYVALKLKNADDRRLNNSISCEYYCGLSWNYNLFDGINLDMYVPVTAKASTQKTEKKTTTEKETTKKKTTVKSKTEKAVKESSTKFSATGKSYYSTSRNETTKFSASGEYTAGSKKYESADTEADGKSDINDKTQVEYEAESTISAKQNMSKQSKLLLIIFGVLFTVGVICVIIGSANGNKKKKENE